MEQPRKQKPDGTLRLSVSVAQCMRVLIAIAVVLAVLSYAGQLAVRAFDWHPERDIVQFFNLDRERNLPTTFQTLLLLGCSLSLAGIAVMKRLQGDRWTRHWAMLGAVFALLAWDEIAEIHERFIQPLRQAFDLQGILFFGWVVPAAAVLLLLGLAYLRFVLALEQRTRLLFVLSAALFVGGALITEAIGGWYYERIDQSTDMLYVTIATIEESFEMAGLILFLYTLLTHLSAALTAGRIELSGEPGRMWIDAVRDQRPSA